MVRKGIWKKGMAPTQFFQRWNHKIKFQWKLAFFSAVCIGMLIHMPALLADIPNHDGLEFVYSSQNNISSGRWFLTVACGFSSYYTIPWMIGLLGLVYLGLTAAVLTEILELDKNWAIVLCSGLLVSFPALASTFAYVFVLDGYMFAMLLAALSVLLTKKRRLGFFGGAVCLAFSLGTYQAYLPFAMILCLFALVIQFDGEGSVAEKVKSAFRYFGMGALGAVLYFVILRVLLLLEGRELVDYQGISGAASQAPGLSGLLSNLIGMYRDFFAFTLKGGVIFHNAVSFGALMLLALSALLAGLAVAKSRKWWKNPWFFVIMVGVAAVVPLATNAVLLLSPDVTYHLLMRYQWVLYLIGLTAFVSKGADVAKRGAALEWAALLAAFVLVFFYGLSDNIAYYNLQKRYEKTYAYCVRLLDRIEQTAGYYPGIPVAMVGVVGQEQFPITDITLPVTAGMIGMSAGESGDILLYTGVNYREFMEHYLGATLNILPPEAMAQMYYSEEYIAMDSFPGKNSIRIIDGIMYIKTENVNRGTADAED